MDKFKIIILINIFILLLFFGCSTKKIGMKSIVPAKIKVLTPKNRRKITVSKFTNDNIQLSSRIESALASIKVAKKPFFTIINRMALDKILKEQQFQASELVAQTDTVKIGKLLGAQIIITGNVVSNNKDNEYISYIKKCIVYDKKGNCIQTKVFPIICHISSASISVPIQIIDIKTAQVLYATTITKNYLADDCKADKYYSTQKSIPSMDALNQLADDIAQEFAKMVAPSYIYYNVELMEKIKSVDLNDKQEKYFKKAIDYISHNRLDKAEKILEKLHNETNGKAYEISYDLGLVKQAKNDYKEALILFEEADDNSEEANILIDKAINNIKDIIKKRERLKRELQGN